MPASAPASHEFVPETGFGRWFLNTQTWTTHVLRVAIQDLKQLLPNPAARFPVVLDAGCGHGRSLSLLAAAFQPDVLIGLDAEALVLHNARARAGEAGAGDAGAARLVLGDCTRLPLRDASIDLLFCHQTLHHLVDQDRALAEFFRVLRPGGVLLVAESTKAYIHSWIIRLLFRHPMDVQRTADEYLGMIRAHGFAVRPDAVSYPYLWWSRADLALAERALRIAPKPPEMREETLINVVAVKPG